MRPPFPRPVVASGAMITILSDCRIRCCTAALFLVGGWALAQTAEPMKRVDRIVAIVDEDPILLSELDQMIALGLTKPEADETASNLQRRVLDALIKNRLRFHEVNRFGFSEMPIELVDEEVEAIQERFGTAAEFANKLDGLGLGVEGLRQLIAQRLMTLIYVEERLGPRIFVEMSDIQSYFDDVLKPEMERTGQAVPQIQDVREQIRAVLRESRLNEQIEIWTSELRAEADVVDYLDSDPKELPTHLVEAPSPTS